MLTHEWPAHEYAIGSYIQATVAYEYLSHILFKPQDSVLDIGCGDGSFSIKILNKIPHGQLLGIDRSENMLKLAREKIKTHPHFSVENMDLLDINFTEKFDYVVSFWCLQWCSDLKKAFSNINRALKPLGKMMTLFPNGDDPFMSSFNAVKNSTQFPFLKKFVLPVNYQKEINLPATLAKMPFSNVIINTPRQSITLPSLDIFRKFVFGVAFLQGQVPDDKINEVNEAIVQAYNRHCQEKYNGEYHFDFSLYVITAEK